MSPQETVIPFVRGEPCTGVEFRAGSSFDGEDSFGSCDEVGAGDESGIDVELDTIFIDADGTPFSSINMEYEAHCKNIINYRI